MRKAMRALLTTGLISLLPLCGCGDTAKPLPSAGVSAASDTRFDLGVSGKKLRVRVAVTDLELATGLMNTPALPADEGMVFVYRDVAVRRFWMANVPYDIDIGYFDDAGTLTDTHRLRANDTEPVASESSRVRYALETPAGWYAAQGLKPGAKLDLAALAAALEARGFRAKDFTPAK